MQQSPPTYESAISRDAWAIVAPHTLSSRTRISDLRSACLVSRRWHEIFTPYLWGDPASHFEGGEGYDGGERDLCDAISCFRRNLKIVRLSVRKQTHTLRLPPARSEIYGGPKQMWLRDLLEYLPSLQALVVSGLSFFDHGALMGLRGVGAGGGLRLLCADRETNATSAGLVEGLGHFPKLVYLDLSYTASAKDPGVLRALGRLGDLMVLKVRGVRMRDDGVEVLTGSIGVKVRVLDLRDNLLTNDGVNGLIGVSFLRAEEGVLAEEGLGGGETGPGLEDVLGAEGLRSEDLDGRVVDMLKLPYAKQPAFEYLPHSGVMHLFISGNRLSGDGVARLLASKRLCVLDAGSVDGADESMMEGSEPLSAAVSAARRIIPVLVTSAAKSLTYLRVIHSVITEDAPIMDVSGSTDLLEERLASTRISEGQKNPPEPTQDSPSNARERKIEQLLAKRPKALTIFQRPSNDRVLQLHPSHLRNLTTLVLTDIPSTIPASSNIIPSLIRFISSCADESLLATLQSQSNYSLPPGRFRASAERRHARYLFPLLRIILEITPVSATGAESNRKQSKLATGGWNSEYHNNPAFLKSSTGDQDGERLFAAAAHDFSFFGDGNDEEGDGVVPLVSEEYRRKKVLQEARNRNLEVEIGPRVDVVSALAQFRREKRRELEELVNDAKRKRKGNGRYGVGLDSGLPIAAMVEGHWEGEVKIVRN